MIENFRHQIKEKDLDLVGLGNAIVDIIAKVDDDFLIKNKLKKGSMNLINKEESLILLESCNILKQVSGGSTANTVVCLAALGNKVEFIGRVKDDYYGNIFSKDIKESGTIFNLPKIYSNESSAHSIILVTPDAQRTMCTYLGASIEFEPNDVNYDSIKKSKYLYLEGYLWDSELAKKAFIQAAQTARESDTKIILSLSDAFCVDRHRKSFLNLIKDFVHILFCNEEELKSLFETSNFNDCVKSINQICELCVVTLGDKGSLIINKGRIDKIDPINFGKVLDTTGAGDIYAGGFIHGLINDFQLQLCGNFGSHCAGQIVTQLGSRSKINLKELIHRAIKK